MGSFNGTGTFVRTYYWTTDEGNGVNIEASRMDTEDDGFATGLSTCITKDGQTTISANIPFNSKKITGLANGSARTDSIALGQVQDSTYQYLAENGGAADAYTFSPSPPITAYAAGQSWIVLIGSGDGNTGASTFNISAVDSRDLKKSDGAGSVTDLESGDLVAGGVYRIIDDGTQGVVQNPEKPYLNMSNMTGATTAVAGKAFLTQQVDLSFNATDADHDMDFSAGVFDFSGGDGQAVASALTKKLDATWVAGDDAGGLADALTIANSTYYHCFALSNVDGSTTDFGFDTSVTATNLLADTNVIAAGLTKYSRVGRIITDGSANIDQNILTQVTGLGQITTLKNGAVASTTSDIPFDDTIPQITEGASFMAVNHTPLRANTKLKIDVVGNWGQDTNEMMVVALFQDSISNALAATALFPSATLAYSGPTPLSHSMVAGTTSDIAFQVRAGGNTGAGGTITFNGSASARKLGGAMASSITITEY